MLLHLTHNIANPITEHIPIFSAHKGLDVTESVISEQETDPRVEEIISSLRQNYSQLFKHHGAIVSEIDAVLQKKKKVEASWSWNRKAEAGKLEAESRVLLNIAAAVNQKMVDIKIAIDSPLTWGDASLAIGVSVADDSDLQLSQQEQELQQKQKLKLQQKQELELQQIQEQREQERRRREQQEQKEQQEQREQQEQQEQQEQERQEAEAQAKKERDREAQAQKDREIETEKARLLLLSAAEQKEKESLQLRQASLAKEVRFKKIRIIIVYLTH